MKIQVMSDLHFEHMRPNAVKAFFESFIKPRPDTTLVLAGDITSCSHHHGKQNEALAQFSDFAAAYRNVVYVPGNHEHYGSSIGEVAAYLDRVEKALPNFHVLRRGRVKVLDGYRFLGDTMWVRSHHTNKKYERFLSDFRFIEEPHTMYLENRDFRLFLNENLKQGDIVVTHHLPCSGSVAAEYAGDQLNRFFLSNEEMAIYTYKPALWIHGHTHHQFDYVFDETRIVANPKGYPNEYTSKGWNPEKIIELSVKNAIP